MKHFFKSLLNALLNLFNKDKEVETSDIQNNTEAKEEEIQLQEKEKEDETPVQSDEITVAETEENMDNKTLELILVRSYFCGTYTIGHIYINDAFFCDTIEDIDRGLSDEMKEEEIFSKKVYGETAIPYGKYEIDMNTKSPKYSNFTKYTWAKPYDAKIPRLLNVKGFSGILIHCGNTEKDTCGCLIVGENKVKGKVINSTITFNKLMNDILLPAYKEGKKIYVNIIKKASC